MNNSFLFKYNLSIDEKNEIIEFYNSFSFISINQFPDWEKINNPNKKICYYLNRSSKQLSSYCIIVENKRIAYVNYGPVAKTNEEIINSIKKINEYYKKRKFFKVVVKLGIIDDFKINEITKPLKKQFSESNYPFNWSTLILNLKEKNIEEIFKTFSKNHKRSIKKAIKNNLKVKIITNLKDVKSLSLIYDKMYSKRKLVKSFNDTHKVFSDIYSFFKKNKNGYLLGVYNENKIIGGLILPIQNNTIYYQYGVASIEYRHFPILHIGFYEAIKLAIEKNIEYFDFGGYIPDIQESNQIYNINRFKDGFRGDILYYPKNMHFILSPVKYKIYNIIKKIYLRLFR